MLTVTRLTEKDSIEIEKVNGLYDLSFPAYEKEVIKDDKVYLNIKIIICTLFLMKVFLLVL